MAGIPQAKVLKVDVVGYRGEFAVADEGGTGEVALCLFFSTVGYVVLRNVWWEFKDALFLSYSHKSYSTELLMSRTRIITPTWYLLSPNQCPKTNMHP